jgi:type III restriction enzyme
MQFKFDSDLPHQKAAWEAIVALFEGQESCYTPFTMPQVQAFGQGSLELGANELGTANRLVLSTDELLTNLKKVQLQHGLKPATRLDKDSLNYTVEMETGTGKTYVYLRSIYELNQAYGMTKFIIVVPSVAIREGVKKSIEMTKEHLAKLYKGSSVDAFIYDSANLEQVRSFAESSHIQIMIINIDSFRRSFTDPNKETAANIIHRINDRLEGMRPIELIAQTNPVVIIDEPQSVDTTAKSAEAIASLNPLVTLRFSATHKDKHQPIYKLDAVDAYNQKLVKQIAVLPVLPEDDHNNPYIKLLEVRNQNGIEARIEIDSLLRSGGIKRERKWVKQGADLYEITKRDLYEGYIVKDISAVEGNEWIDFTSKSDVIQLGKSIGGVDELALKRLQIRKTIETHLDRQLLLEPKGIKVLSLFFIDKVANYRIYNEDGEPKLGIYGQIFEEEYQQLAKHPKYQSLFNEMDLSTHVSQIHDGYFAADKTGKLKGRFKDTSGKTAADESIYDLIMKDKERLLKLETPLRFIFSHSALREGWDNPNVFQICTLNETESVIKKRQEIGRGLRLAVDQTGNRVTDNNFSINTLTVVANESYKAFTEALQKEIEEADGIRFGVVETHSFANLIVKQEGENMVYLGTEDSEKLWEHLKAEGFIDNIGRVQDSLKRVLKHDLLALPTAYEPIAPQVNNLLKKIAGGLDVKDASKAFTAKPKKEIILGADFTALWDTIKHKTIYQVDFDLDRLVDACTNEIRHMLVSKPKFLTGLANITIDRSGVGIKDESLVAQTYDAEYTQLPDILTYLQNETQLTRRTIAKILTQSNRLNDFAKNPQRFVQNVLAIIQKKKMHALVDGIKYEKIGEHAYYTQECFLNDELKGYLEQNLMEVNKSVYSHIIYDSTIESDFAKALEANNNVKLYSKLPSWFKIDTPLGSYNPDWAILFQREGEDRLYFVVETKGNLFLEDLRDPEKDKITCGREHFKAIGTPVEFFYTNDAANLEIKADG